MMLRESQQQIPGIRLHFYHISVSTIWVHDLFSPILSIFAPSQPLLSGFQMANVLKANHWTNGEFHFLVHTGLSGRTVFIHEKFYSILPAAHNTRKFTFIAKVTLTGQKWVSELVCYPVSKLALLNTAQRMRRMDGSPLNSTTILHKHTRPIS